MSSTLVSCALRMSLKQRPISFLLTVETATISLKRTLALSTMVLGRLILSAMDEMVRKALRRV